jgi:hypothetical protein
MVVAVVVVVVLIEGVVRAECKCGSKEGQSGRLARFKERQKSGLGGRKVCRKTTESLANLAGVSPLFSP